MPPPEVWAEARARFPSQRPEGTSRLRHLGCRLLAPRTMGRYISVVLSHPGNKYRAVKPFAWGHPASQVAEEMEGGRVSLRDAFTLSVPAALGVLTGPPP